jgi:hypothetical protein
MAGTVHQDDAGNLISNRSYSFPAWTNITGFQNNVVFFYNSATGKAATGTLDNNGFTQAQNWG